MLQRTSRRRTTNCAGVGLTLAKVDAQGHLEDDLAHGRRGVVDAKDAIALGELLPDERHLHLVGLPLLRADKKACV
jgi:hypothetical protein